MTSVISGLSVSLTGLQTAEKKVVKAVNEIQKVFAHAASPTGQVLPTDERAVTDAVQGAVLPTVDATGGDLAKPIVDLLQAKVAYQANLFAAKVTADVESDAVRLLKKLV
jgi:flagellar basal body rod protein FlgC